MCLTIATCISYKKYQQQEIIREKKDDSGRLIMKKYRQLISWPSHDNVATITQEYDTLGRVVKEYGFNHPAFYDKKYLVEKVYQNSSLFLTNKFIWWKTDSTDNFSNYDNKLFEETIFPDSTNPAKKIFISMTEKVEGIFSGYFEETFPTSTNSWTSNAFTFELHEKDISFDKQRRLVLDSIIKK